MSQQTQTVEDQMGREVTFRFPPKRIISLVPSQTELLYDLGLEENIVGITKFCERPEFRLKTKTKVGGTKKLRHEVIAELRADLIIGNKEENRKEDIELLMNKYPVWMSDIVTFDDALQMIRAVGELTGKKESACQIVDQILKGFEKSKKYRGKVLYLIWTKPWMGVGSGTFVHALLSKIGLTNVLEKRIRYPELTPAEIQKLNPEHVFLSSEPFPFGQKHAGEIKEILPWTGITFVDGQFFSWPGSRLIGASTYFNNLKLSVP